MQNAYISSSITYRSRGCVYYSSNDCYLLNNRASSCSLCTCCSFPINGVSLGPRFFYGLRQSTLIHWPASRKLVLGGGDRFCRLPICNVGRVCYNECCTAEESFQCRCSGRRRRRIGCMVWEEGSESCDLGSDGTMEAMLSLLSEESDENYVGVRERRSRFAAERARGEKSRISDYRRREKDVECDSSKWNAKGRFEYVRKSREDESRLLGRTKGSLRGEKLELRKDGSACSSYYSLLSSDEIEESDVDVQFNNRAVVESSRRNKNKESRRGRDEVIVKNVIEQSTRNDNDGTGLQGISTGGNDSVGYTSVEAGSNFHSRNVRKNMRTDVSARQEESRTESLTNRSNVLKSHKSDAETSSASENRFSGRGDSSLLSSISVDETKQINSQAGSASRSQPSFRGSEESLTATVDSVDEERKRFSQTGNFSIEQIESRRKSHQLRMSDSHDNGSRRSSTSQRFSESRLKNMEESTSFLSSYQEAEVQDIQSDQKVGWATRSTEELQGLTTTSVTSNSDTALVSNSQKLSERRMSPQDEISASVVPIMSKSYDSDIRKTSTSQRLYGQLKERKESSTSLRSSFHEAELRLMQTDQRVVQETKSTKGSQDLTGMSATSVSDMTTVGGFQRSSEIQMIPQEESSVSVVSFIGGSESGGKSWQESEHETKQLRSRKESERLTEISSFRENSANRGSSSQTLNFDQRASDQRIHDGKETGKNLQVTVVPPPSKIVDGTSQEDVCYKKPGSGCAKGDVYSETPGSGSSTLYEQEIAPSSPGELERGLGKDHMYEEKSDIMFHEDALGSANRLEESSTEFVRQFVEKLTHEVSISELQEEKTSSQTTLNYNDEEYTQQVSSLQVPEDVHSQVHDSRRSFIRSRVRGPSDEMWDVAGPSAAKPARGEAPGKVPSATESAIVRTGKSLWSIVGDIVRLRWGARSGTHNSTINSGGKSSSNESVGSEAWFSSHDTDEKDDENVKKGRQSMPKFRGSSSRPSLGKTGTQSLGGDSECMSSNNNKIEIKADAVSSLNTLEGSSASKGASSASKGETFSWKSDERRNSETPSSNLTASLSLPLPPRHLTRSPAVNDEISDSDKAVASRSGFMQMEQPGRESPTESSGAEVKDGELKHRKLQRNKQVKTQTFEEWEEAYTLENEQRKTDEIFMKEALLEAKKAADVWEVPVGAVLVQHGKIVARGCNLVEDLRDSTAHAEMICIREASKLLQTWRLSAKTIKSPAKLSVSSMLRDDSIPMRNANSYVTFPLVRTWLDNNASMEFGGWGMMRMSGSMSASMKVKTKLFTLMPTSLTHKGGGITYEDVVADFFPDGVKQEALLVFQIKQLLQSIHFTQNDNCRVVFLASECADAMQQFFQLRRRKEKKEDSPTTSSLPVSHHPSKFFSKMHDMFSIMFCL
ncbi:hypothetical protein IFM89_030703 [Coptis chinensis]|uniref:CMP/dCMP-type deaminase domain-containing protein n=1 Tax=Coptis chinensis TaxID=261450 RepID=A0A835MB36_9MAGN|nr:hypothetical protein IFM89_030703 [Coptis chinensis]